MVQKAILYTAGLFIIGHSLIVAPLYGQAPQQDLQNLSFEDLMNVRVITASRIEEPESDAPAAIIVITRQDIIDRCYNDLSDLLDDLPGMDVVRINNDISFKNYWRGFRNTFGAPYLFLIDGMPWRDLYYNDAEVMRALPLSNIERVEVVYGPASSVYGANAFNGVINVITVKSLKNDGTQMRGRFSGGNQDLVMGDFNIFYQKNDLKLSCSVRFENGEDFPETADLYEWSKRKYVEDRRLWGGFTDSPATAGATSPRRHRSLHFRSIWKDIEAGVQYYELTSSYGCEYAADKVLPNVVWTKVDYSAYFRYTKALNHDITSRTTLRRNRSDIPNSSALAEGFNTTDETGSTRRVINYELWQTLNSSVSFSQDFEAKYLDRYFFRSGFRYEQKDLQKAYEIASGPFMEPEEVFADNYPFPRPPSATPKYQNRILTEDKSGYINMKAILSERFIVHSGLRYDHNSQYGSATTLRTGVIHRYNKWTFKMLYGQGFQEPSPRVLYGSWLGLGSDPDLKPERSQTFEFIISRRSLHSHLTVSLYNTHYHNTILNLQKGGRNVGRRDVFGIDCHLKYIPPGVFEERLQFWGYYSYIHTQGDEIYDAVTDRYTNGPIGDIAPHKAQAGVNMRISTYIKLTFTGRFIDQRQTVDTNPISSVAGYALLDMACTLKDLPVEGLSISLKVNNLTDKAYFHPGIRTADAGTTPGFFDDDGVWHGSSGWLNSLLPQFKRRWMLSLQYNL